MQLAPFEFLCRSLRQRFECASIPDHDSASAILALRNSSFEIKVGNGMILDLHGEALFPLREGHPLRHCPGFQSPPEFQSKIVV